MTDDIHLYLIETTAARADHLTSELASISQVTVLQSYVEALAVSGGLDAVLVPLMSAMELGSIKPPVPLYQTRVIKMPDYEVARGRPRYGIPGIATSSHESLKPVDCTRLIFRESFRAIHRFNEANSPKLMKVAASSLSLGRTN